MQAGKQHGMGVRRFGRVNWLGLYTLALRETMRYLNVWMQTLLAPLITAGLFLTVFSLAIGPARGDVKGVAFTHFLAPGILMMTVIQNAFTNTSSSILVSKIQRNIVDTLMPPLSPMELLVGYIAGALGRGVLVAGMIWLGLWLFLDIGIAHSVWAAAFVLLGSALMGGIGIIAAIYATKFDQLAAITNFIIVPLSFLSGTFYSVEVLPPLIRALTHWNPVFYLIDGVRFGILGVSDSSPWLGLTVCGIWTLGILGLCWSWFRSGYRLKS